MSVELKVPSAGESITEVILGMWLKKEGEGVKVDDPIVEIDTDKVSMEVPSPANGVISKILKKQGETAAVGEVIALIEEGAAPAASAGGGAKASVAAPAKAAAAPAAAAQEARVMPAAARAMATTGVSPQQVQATGPGGRVLKEDVMRAAEAKSAPSAGAVHAAQPAAQPAGARTEEAVKMTPMRKKIAERLVQSQHTAAILTTYNEIDMTAVMELRNHHKDEFEKRYGIKLGFMSFFAKASIEALKLIPAANAQLRGDDIIYHHYYDIGIAVGGGKGLVVPILRNAERMSFAQIELAISDFGKRARDNKITLEELQGGTFTISNGGVYGSLMSMPILNPPQAGILGLHAIQERPVARNGQVVIRPMMYVALSYDHRLIDGREAVTFLKRVKECIEEPARMLVEI